MNTVVEKDRTRSTKAEAGRGLTQSQLEATQSLRRASVGDAEAPEADAEPREVDAEPEKLMLGRRWAREADVDPRG